LGAPGGHGELQEAILSVQRLKTLILLVFSMKMEVLGSPGRGFRGQGLWC
jgi:hypothetical protein